jgi:hypothetical protein
VSAIDHGFDLRLDQTKGYKIGICCFSAKHAALSDKGVCQLYVLEVNWKIRNIKDSTCTPKFWIQQLLCNHLKEDDDVTRSTMSSQGKNTPCLTFIMDGLMLYYIKLFLHLAKVDKRLISILLILPMRIYYD